MNPSLASTVDYQALIAGECGPAASGRTLESVNPANGETIGRFPRCDVADVERAVEAAASAFATWSRRTAAERAEVLYDLAGLVEEHEEELALLDTRDNGSTLTMMRGDVRHAVDQVRYFAGLALQLRGETLPAAPGRLNYTLRQPFGVVARIIPFNHPLMFAVTKIAAPLLAGNTVVLKPSEHTSLSALRLGELLADRLPAGVVNVVPGLGPEVGDALVTHPEVRRVAFIGSVATGRMIQGRAAAGAVKTVTLELGGKNPLVVFPDADLELALDGAQKGMNFTWQGQSCGSTSRLLVHRAIHDEFVERLVERVGSLRSGLPEDPRTETGAIVNQAQYEKVDRYLELGVAEGARLLTGGDRPDDPALAGGLFKRPAVFDQVKPDSRLAQEEIFGPVLAVLPFDDYTEALEIANGVSYGLTAGVFTRDLETAHRFAEDVEAGYVWVNDSSRHLLGAAFGVGREEGVEELDSYTQVKNVQVRFGAGE
jgi:acyl-CoA reductase-like NAD-dependent aldehyde dehydrogenase